MRPYAEIAQDVEYHVVDLIAVGYRLDNLARQYPTIAKRHRGEIEAVREQLNDILSRLERNWDQVAAE